MHIQIEIFLRGSVELVERESGSDGSVGIGGDVANRQHGITATTTLIERYHILDVRTKSLKTNLQIAPCSLNIWYDLGRAISCRASNRLEERIARIIDEVRAK